MLLTVHSPHLQYVQMNWNTYHAMVGDVGFFIDRKSDSRWELWYMSPKHGHRKIGSSPSPDRCMDLITPENFAARGITLDPICLAEDALRWVRCSPSA
jgi:hypothetical protein